MNEHYSSEKIDEIINKYKRNYSYLSPEARKFVDKLISMREKLREADKKMLEQEKREQAAKERLEAAKKRYNHFNQLKRTEELLKYQRENFIQSVKQPCKRCHDTIQLEIAKQEAQMLLSALESLVSQ